ncbi:hypothetical protein LCGC14_1582150 [marine sediment metagenome]|uniref:Uncharacterized protein n=1 Tax=marine sediment metagenome TaxID=412755 RepID=A0A0F9IGH7_9ZZZZ
MIFDISFIEQIYPNGKHLLWLIKMGLHEIYIISHRGIL